MWQANLAAYREKCSVQFDSSDEINAFIDLIWKDKDLKGMPHVPVGDNTMIIPYMARKMVSRKLSGQLRFKICKVLNPGDLKGEELKKLLVERRSA